MVFKTAFIISFVAPFLFVCSLADQGHGKVTQKIPILKGISDIFQDAFVHDKEHLKEDIKEHYHVDLDAKATDHELDFYYFQMHDFDENKLLDGLEILMALNHVIDFDALNTKEAEGAKPDDPAELVAKLRKKWNDKFADDSKIIDELLREYDKDWDGFLSYAEFSVARASLIKK